MRKLAAVFGVAAGALLWCGHAAGQVIDHTKTDEGPPQAGPQTTAPAKRPESKAEVKAPAAAPAAPTREWRDLLRVEKERDWDVAFRVSALLIQPIGTRDVTSGVFCMPWIQRSATQQSDDKSLSMSVSINDTPMDGQLVWLESPKGMERLRAMIVNAPAGKGFNFAATANPFGNSCPPPLGPVMKSDLEVTYRVTVRRVRLDERAAANVRWPRQWPPEAQGALDPQVFLDTGVDPDTRLVREL